MDIEKLVEERQAEVKEPKNQVTYGLVLIFVIFILCIFIWKSYYTYAICLGLGIIIGVTLRYSRFCFAAAFRNLFITRNTRILRGILLGLIVSTVGFAIIQSSYIPNQGSSYGDIPGAVRSVGLHVMVGAFVFGMGMVLAGGCASGMLMRIGEGHIIFVVVLIGFIIGTLLAANDNGFFNIILNKNAKTIYFPEYLGLKTVAAIQVIILMILYKLAQWREKRGN